MFISFAADYWHWTVRTVIWKKFIRLYQEPIEILNFHWIEGNWNFLRDSIWDIGMELTATIKQVVIDIISYHNFLTMKISISTISSNLYRWFILIVIENITTKKKQNLLIDNYLRSPWVLVIRSAIKYFLLVDLWFYNMKKTNFHFVFRLTVIFIWWINEIVDNIIYSIAF